MNKRINISGMSCQHCTGRVKKALSALAGAEVSVDLTGADIAFVQEITDEILTAAVEAAGYEVVSIEER